MRRGENDVYEAPGKSDREEWVEEDRQALVQVKELIKELSETQPILKSLLDTAVVELEEHVASPGRQLLQREDYTLLMTDSLSEHALQKSVGLRGIPGLTSFSCEAVCASVAAEADENCKAFAFKRSDPWSRTDLTGSCHLLKNSGACKVEDFATELYTRSYESERVCSEITPGYDSATCIGLPATTADSEILTHSDAAAIAAAYVPRHSNSLSTQQTRPLLTPPALPFTGSLTGSRTPRARGVFPHHGRRSKL